MLARDDAPAKIDVGVTYHASFVSEDDVDGIANVPVAFFKGTADWMFSDSFLDQVRQTPYHWRRYFNDGELNCRVARRKSTTETWR